ncbi:hypothetical protein DQ04_01261000 [Trypanosoma grayi]|uniref:hypothetical protein n=1 Tax=Trypanosoma grayi TaxID=71804 RepID=UPI0004F458E9|nr:hypothetical protein DQ04_01261000 [Trypanosoma grayi]KEG13019.1 hypothetical protein DQ04_01261000 [Trypanosoma grayi]
MDPATQDAIETMRQLQKLSRELQPVKTALAALLKRERVNPNPLAAAGSVDKIALRVLDVSRKYSAFFDRASYLLNCELPRLQRLTPLLEVSEKNRVDSAQNGHEKAEVHQDAFRHVCSPNVPHIMRPMNYHMVQETLRLHMEMVDYLIATERYQLARRVADAYGLPLYWFPKLVTLALPALPPIQGNSNNNTTTSEERGRDSGSLSASTFVSPFLTATATEEAPMSIPAALEPVQIAIQCIEGRHSVTEAIAYCEERLLSALECIDTAQRRKITEVLDDLLIDLHATRLLQIYRDGRADQQSIIQYIAAHLLPRAMHRPIFVQTIINTVTLHEPYTSEMSRADGGGQRSPTPKSKKVIAANKDAAQLVASMMSVEGYHKLAMSFHRVVVLVGSQMVAMIGSVRRDLGFASEENDQMNEWRHTLPDLATRIVATSIFLKDEYLDRMVVERRASVGPLVAPISESHLNTQSGSAAFDEAMIAVVEETLSRLPGLRPHSSSNSNSNNLAPLTATELLAAEEEWSNNVLFIKRPTRFYCYFTKECFDGGTGGNYPIALPNGTVVSKVAMMQSCLKKTGEGDRSQSIVVCPRTKEEFSFSSLKRIFVT